MADIKLRTGEILYQFPSEVAHALICLGLAEKFVPLPPEKKVGSLTFYIDRTRSSGEPYVHYQCDMCSQSGALLNSNPAGSPGRSAAKSAEESARAFVFWHCGKKEVLPEALVQDFKKAFE
jgi:hypothetical protein